MDLLPILDKGHIYLKKYKIIAVFIILFSSWQCYDLTEWYKLHFHSLKDWQNVALVGMISGYVAVLKFALEHILAPHND